MKNLAFIGLLTITLNSHSQTWSLNGNSGTSGNFLGTTNQIELVVKTNNIERMRVGTNGNVGFGTQSPSYPLHIVSGDNSTGYNGMWQQNGLLIKNTGSWGASCILENNNATPIRWYLTNSCSSDQLYNGSFFISRLDNDLETMEE
jgi:hypothetical protein